METLTESRVDQLVKKLLSVGDSRRHLLEEEIVASKRHNAYLEETLAALQLTAQRQTTDLAAARSANTVLIGGDEFVVLQRSISDLRGLLEQRNAEIELLQAKLSQQTQSLSGSHNQPTASWVQLAAASERYPVVVSLEAPSTPLSLPEEPAAVSLAICPAAGHNRASAGEARDATLSSEDVFGGVVQSPRVPPRRQVLAHHSLRYSPAPVPSCSGPSTLPGAASADTPASTSSFGSGFIPGQPLARASGFWPPSPRSCPPQPRSSSESSGAALTAASAVLRSASPPRASSPRYASNNSSGLAQLPPPPSIEPSPKVLPSSRMQLLTRPTPETLQWVRAGTRPPLLPPPSPAVFSAVEPRHLWSTQSHLARGAVGEGQPAVLQTPGESQSVAFLPPRPSASGQATLTPWPVGSFAHAGSSRAPLWSEAYHRTRARSADEHTSPMRQAQQTGAASLMPPALHAPSLSSKQLKPPLPGQPHELGSSTELQRVFNADIIPPAPVPPHPVAVPPFAFSLVRGVSPTEGPFTGLPESLSPYAAAAPLGCTNPPSDTHNTIAVAADSDGLLAATAAERVQKSIRQLTAELEQLRVDRHTSGAHHDQQVSAGASPSAQVHLRIPSHQGLYPGVGKGRGSPSSRPLQTSSPLQPSFTSLPRSPPVPVPPDSRISRAADSSAPSGKRITWQDKLHRLEAAVAASW